MANWWDSIGVQRCSTTSRRKDGKGPAWENLVPGPAHLKNHPDCGPFLPRHSLPLSETRLMLQLSSAPLAEQLRSKIELRTARVAVVGLGYVGLPLAETFAWGEFPVVGFDIDPEKVRKLDTFELTPPTSSLSASIACFTLLLST